ncbi:MAG: hypothetical protein K2L93_08575 [Muribaculaceae bacterium]|nr:hypothetical protein [Muribaculaceae bacterium]MDE6322337.1 hypothetical protein [Muribaculaceae bacterium]
MKHKILYMAAMLGMVAFTACDDDWETPPTGWPTLPAGIEANENLADFKETFWSEANTPFTIGDNDEGEHYIIEGRVVSDDRYSNIYKNLIIQAEDGTGLTFAVNNSSLYKTYLYGQKVVIDLTGLDLGYYSGLLQVGQISGTSMSFAAEDFFNEHAYPVGLPEPEKVVATTATLEELQAALSDENQKRYWMSRYVTIEDVTFVGAGLLTFADAPSVGSGTNRYIRNENGRTLLVRNSTRATFQDVTMPVGTGSVSGILSYYNNDWQLLINDTADCKGFRWIDAGATEPTMVANTTIKEFKQMYWSDERNSAELVGTNEDGEDIIVAGTVISSDESGNIYKNLVIRDESGEAMTLAINATALYTTFPQGQEIVLKLTGLYAGMYNNLFQVGGLGSYNGAPSMTFMEASDFMSNVELDGTPDAASVVPVDATIEAINDANTSAGKKQWQSQLVTFKGVKWQGGGEMPYVQGGANTNRYILDSEGNSLLVRNSAYADFANETMPAGTGNVTGILSYYGTDWQLLLISSKSSADFK